MDTLNELVHRTKCLTKEVNDFKQMEYPDNCPTYWNDMRRAIIHLSLRCYRLSCLIETKET